MSELTELRKEVADLRKQVAAAREGQRMAMSAEAGWKRVANTLQARIDTYEQDGVAATLVRERDDYKRRWRNATRRLAVVLEREGAGFEAAYRTGFAVEAPDAE